jgi:hypothetical protein
LAHNTRGSVNRYASYIAISQFDLSRVKTGSKRQANLFGGSSEG